MNHDEQQAFAQWLELLRSQGEQWQGVWGPATTASALGVADLMQQQLALWQGLASGQVPPISDPRFSAPEWQRGYFAFVQQSYLLTCKQVMATVAQVPFPEPVKQRLSFLTRQYLDAISPANFLATNPQAQEKARQTGGASLEQGRRNLQQDVARGRISMSDESGFRVGDNLACTPGAVVFENALMQLIQYQPSTASVFRRPLLLVPPCINKFYVLDLQPHNSLVKALVEQGFTVFMLSWRNIGPGCGLEALRWDDYVEQGVIAAIDCVCAIGGQEAINAMGFCIGGTLLSCAAAVLQARGRATLASMSHLTTMLDHADPGEVRCLLDEPLIAYHEAQFAQGAVLSGQQLGEVFASLRANELVWRYVVRNYLLGQTPPPFDLLYWNADCSDLPLPMFIFYLREIVLRNLLPQPGQLQVCGESVNLGQLALPCYLFAAREDHIVPWTSAYASTRLLRGELTFVLGAAGHIAGTINPTAAQQRHYWTHADLSGDAEHWLAGATRHAGSWWPHWLQWLEQHSLGRVRARKRLGNARYKPLEAAPGRYVLQRSTRQAGG